MANRWLFAGSDQACFRTRAGTLSTSTSLGLDSGWCNTSLAIGTGITGAADFTTSASPPVADSATSGETLWIHAIWNKTSNGTTAFNWMEVNNSSDHPWVTIRWKSGTTYGIFYNSNTGASPTWTQVGTDFTLVSGDTNVTVDMKIVIGSPHTVDLYLDNGGGSALNQSVSFTQALFTQASNVTFSGSNGNSRVGSVLASVGYPTIAAHCCNRYPTGAGATNTFTSGTYADIDELGVNDADLMASNTAAQRATFVYSDIPTLSSGYAVGDTFVYTRAKNDGTAPNNLKPTRRDSGGTDNVGSSFSGMGVTFGNFLARYQISETEFNASQFGFDSAT